MSEFQKYPDNKRQYDIGYLRAFGRKCPACKGSGYASHIHQPCPKCRSLGHVPKKGK